METFLIIILILALLGAGTGMFLMYKKLESLQKPKDGDQNLFVMLQNQMQEMQRLFDQKMTDTHKAMSETQQNLNKTIHAQFGQSTKVITEITEKLTSLDKTNQQVIGFSDQLNNLQKVLTSQKTKWF